MSRYASRATVSLTPGVDASSTHGGGAVSHSRLENGLEVVVIPDTRTPVVTHMIWYKNGSADDPPGKSGIAHFLEHLMFKGTKNHPQGEFSNLVAELGGQENAFTSYDYTAYFQRIGKDHLETLMRFEADRMNNLVLSDEVVTPERDVVLEERRMRTDSDPAAQLDEAVQAALYAHHPYGTPIIGWNHEIENLGRAENAILIVAGDVDAGTVMRLANETYGRIPSRAQPPQRRRVQEPPHRAHRLVTLSDDKVEQPAHERVFKVPSYRTAAPGEAEALETLAYMLGGGATSALYETLVVDRKLAVSAGAYYAGSAVDDTRFWVFATPAPNVPLEQLDAAIDDVLRHFVDHPIDAAHLQRAKTRLIADAIYAQDSQASLARWYGEALATGLTVADVEAWPTRMDAVDAEAVAAAARQWLDKRRAVTGFLLPA
jgi:zinc protease